MGTGDGQNSHSQMRGPIYVRDGRAATSLGRRRQWRREPEVVQRGKILLKDRVVMGFRRQKCTWEVCRGGWLASWFDGSSVTAVLGGEEALWI